MQTYIIKTASNEFYCGKTTRLLQRLEEHKREVKPHWFASGSIKRKTFIETVVFKGDFEKEIKRAGVKIIYEIVRSAS